MGFVAFDVVFGGFLRVLPWIGGCWSGLFCCLKHSIAPSIILSTLVELGCCSFLCLFGEAFDNAKFALNTGEILGVYSGVQFQLLRMVLGCGSGDSGASLVFYLEGEDNQALNERHQVADYYGDVAQEYSIEEPQEDANAEQRKHAKRYVSGAFGLPNLHQLREK
jgi:hypothetical protein